MEQKIKTFNILLMAGKKMVVRKFNINAPNAKAAEEWGKKIILRKGYDDTLIYPIAKEVVGEAK